MARVPLGDRAYSRGTVADAVLATLNGSFKSPLFDSPDAASIIEQLPASLGAPFLAFSDLTYGPRDGNTDTSQGLPVGENGAIVTIWGNRLGATQGSSTISINGAPAAAIYYWGPAIPPYSPANLVNGYHNMQCIIAQVRADAALGLGEIKVTVGGKQSNGIPFTVSTGRMHFFTATGSDTTGDGTWQKPLLTISSAKLNALVAPGDIVYVGNGVNFNNDILVLNVAGTASLPIALVAYPGAACLFGSSTSDPIYTLPNYWTVGKLSIDGNQTAVRPGYATSLIGCEMIGDAVVESNIGYVNPTPDTDMSHLRILGCEAHNVGTGQNTLYHLLYLSGMRAQATQPPAITDYEVAWCYIHDNLTNRAVNIYNEGTNSAYLESGKIHHNAIVDQCGGAIALMRYTHADQWVWSNILVRCGGEQPQDQAVLYNGIYGGGGWEFPPDSRAGTTYHCWFNTLIDCGEVFNQSTDFSRWNFSGAWHFRYYDVDAYQLDVHNNLTVQTNGVPFFAPAQVAINSAVDSWSHNWWYGNAPDGVPAWEVSGGWTDPMLVDVVSPTPDLHLQANSPLQGRGTPVSAPFPLYDFDGNPISDTAPDIGAYVSTAAALPAWVPVEGEWKYLGTSTIEADAMPDPVTYPSVYVDAHGSNEWVNWTDAAYAPLRGPYGTYYLLIGGHKTISDNSMKAIQIGENPTWEMLGTPTNSTMYDPFTAFGEYTTGPAGQPADSHTFGATMYLSPGYGGGAQGSAVLLTVAVPGEAPGGGSNFGYAFRFDFATNTWSRYSTNERSNPLGRNYAQDDTGHFYAWGSANTISVLDADSQTWNDYPVTKSESLTFAESGAGSPAVYWPEQDLIIYLNNGDTFTAWAIKASNIITGTGQWVRIPSAETHQSPYGAPAFVWCDWLGKFAVYEHVEPGHTSAEVNTNVPTINYIWWLIPPAGNPLTGTWTWEQEFFSNSLGETLPIWVTPSGVNCYDRMLPIPALKSLVFVESANYAMTIWRPRT